MSTLHYNEDIIDQLLVLGVGTRNEIINAINNVINKNDINSILDYILKKKSNQLSTKSINV